MIKLSKLFYALFIIYYGWFQIVFFQIPHMLLILGAGMMGLIIMNALPTRNLGNSLTTELKIWILFTVTSFAFGLCVAVNYQFLTSAISTFSQFLLLMYGIVYISNQDRTIDFFIKMFIVLSVLCAITTVFWGVEYVHTSGQLSMGILNNPNDLGITMAIGVCCILFKYNFEKLVSSIFAFSAILCLIYVAMLTGSRKSFICIVFIIIYWFIFIVFKDLKASQFSTKIKGIILILLVIVAGYYILYPFLEGSVLLTRLNMLSDSGDMKRVGMYSEAFNLFTKSPLVGIGFNNYQAVSIFELYSHSTYAEVLACTGILGLILYFSPYIILLSHYGKLVTSNLNAVLQRQAKVLLGLFGVLLFLGVGVIHFYEMSSSIAFGMLIAFCNLTLNSLEDGASSKIKKMGELLSENYSNY